jgi:DNA polymerase-3 subunit gamma/tau
MLLPAADESSSAVLQRLERMERRLGAAEPADDQPVRAAPAAVDPVPAARRAPAEQATATRPTAPSTVDRPAVGGALDAAAVRRVWDEVLAMVRRRSRNAAAIIGEGVVRDVRADEVIVLFSARAHADLLNNHPEHLLEALHEVLGGTWRVRAEVGGDTRTAQAPTLAASAPHDETSSGSRRPDTAGTGMSPARGAQATPSADRDWPETARPGGATARPAPATPATTAPVKTAPSKAAPATRTRSAPARGGRGREDAPPPDEPPFDPDYDPTPADRAIYDGFDPGDEPLDDATPGIRESSEAQALRAVTEHFAVERIGEASTRP